MSSGGGAEDVGGAAGVAGIDDAAQDAVAGEESIGLIDEKSGAAVVDGAKEGGDGDVGGDQRPMGHLGENAQEGGFAATLFR